MNQKSQKSIALYVLVLVFCVFLSGCVKKDNRIEIKFASWGSQSEIEILKPILNEFEEKNTDLKVEFIHIPQNYFQKIHLLFASNLAPDVIFINNLYLPIYADSGVLEPLDEHFKTKPFYKKSLEALSYKKNLYAIPRDVSNLVIYYNKDIFNKYGVKIPNRYWTFDDFLVISQKLTRDIDNDGKTDLWGISFEKDLFYFMPYLMSEGGGVLSDDLKTDIFDSKETQKGLKFYANLRNKHHVAPTDSEAGSATMAQMFLQGKLAMYLSGRWMVPKFRSDAKFDWNVINFPSGDKGSVVALDASGWAVSKSSKNKDAAYRLLEFLASEESSKEFCKSGLVVPARMDVAQGKILSDKNSRPKSEHVFIDIIKTSKPTPVSVNYSEIQDKIKEKVDYLFN